MSLKSIIIQRKENLAKISQIDNLSLLLIKIN